jgi:hypothetical protein
LELESLVNNPVACTVICWGRSTWAIAAVEKRTKPATVAKTDVFISVSSVLAWGNAMDLPIAN